MSEQGKPRETPPGTVARGRQPIASHPKPDEPVPISPPDNRPERCPKCGSPKPEINPKRIIGRKPARCDHSFHDPAPPEHPEGSWKCDYCGGVHPDDIQICPAWQRDNPDTPTRMAHPEGGEERLRHEEAERIASMFHAVYEQLAPHFGYETRRESRTAWADVPRENRRLMIATVKQLVAKGVLVPRSQLAEARAEVERLGELITQHYTRAEAAEAERDRRRRQQEHAAGIVDELGEALLRGTIPAADRLFALAQLLREEFADTEGER